MNIAISDFGHYQYLKTLIDLFNTGENRIHIFTSEDTELKIKSLSSSEQLNNVIFHSKSKNLFTEYSAKIKSSNLPRFDLFFINPFYPFTYYDGTVKHHYNFIKSINANKRLLSISNLNTWYKPNITRPGHVINFIYRKKILRLINTLVLVDEMELYAKQALKVKKPIINIPFTYYEPFNKEEKENDLLRIVVPGEVSLERRDYYTFLNAIELCSQNTTRLEIQFLGPINYGYSNTRYLISRIDSLNAKAGRELIKLYKEKIPAQKFEEEMRSADLIISPLVSSIKVFETKEFYGTSKFSGATFDIITYRVPGIFPEYLITAPEFSKGIVKYKDYNDLAALIQKIIEDKNYLHSLKQSANLISENCTLEKWREKIFSSLNISLS